MSKDQSHWQLALRIGADIQAGQSVAENQLIFGAAGAVSLLNTILREWQRQLVAKPCENWGPPRECDGKPETRCAPCFARSEMLRRQKEYSP